MLLLLPILIVVLLIASALLAASETALFALVRMEHTREQLSAAVRRGLDVLTARPVESLIVIIGLNESANVFAECLAAAFLLLWLGPFGVYIAAVVMFITVLFLCDITPKTFALAFPGVVAAVTARPLAGLTRALSPIARWVTPAIPTPTPAPVSEAEFKALLHLSVAHGAIAAEERELIHKVFAFGSRRVAEVMTPRDKIFAIDLATPAERLIAEVVAGHFSRIPIYRTSPDNIVGILHVKDLVTRRLEPTPPRLERLIRPAYYVPPGKALADLFDEMRRGRFQIAVVVNEYGRVLGLITLEDLLEELFGEIRDEFDYEGPEIKSTGHDEWLVAGSTEIDRLKQILGDTAFDGAGRQTLGSLVLRRLGRVPRAGEHFRLGAFELKIERVRGATVETVRLRRCI